MLFSLSLTCLLPDSSLCIPKKICSSMALISADIDNIIMPKCSDLQSVVHKLAEVIVDWNCNMHYIDAKLNKKHNEGNCQDFVEVCVMFNVSMSTTSTMLCCGG